MITEINLILYLGISTAAFTTVDYKASRGIKVYQKAYVSVISSLVVLVAIFNLSLSLSLSLSLKGILVVYSDGVRNLY